MSSGPPRLKYAVVDSGPLIKGVRLETLNADGLVTVPEVLKEIRDRQARQMLASLPVELTTREPSSEALTAIKSFAKLTGDLPALSVVDLRVLALAWMLEKEAKGGIDHLRTEPAPVGQTLPRYPRSRQAQTRDEQPKPAVQDPAGASSSAAADDEEEDGTPQEEEVEEVFDDKPCMLLPFLYIGSVEAATNIDALKSTGITHILTVAAELPSSGAPGFHRLHVPLDDVSHQTLKSHLPSCFAFIKSAVAAVPQGKVLVHCVAGRSRAPAVAAAYLMEVKRVTTAKAALSMIEEARPWVEVAKGLVDELSKFEVELNGGSSAPIDIADATIGLPSSFLDSSFSSKAEYEASLKLSDSERLAAELSAAQARQLPKPPVAAQKILAPPAKAMSSLSLTDGYADDEEDSEFEPPTFERVPMDAEAMKMLEPPSKLAPAAEVPWFAAVAAELEGEVTEAAAARKEAEEDAYDEATEAETEARAAKAAARKRTEKALSAMAGVKEGLEESDDLPWITVENLEQMQRRDPYRRAMSIDGNTKVACLTTDYAMQSVLMQIGLPLMGADGLLMKSVKQWVLKCSGCFTLQPTLDRLFCIKCGNQSLVRLQAVLDVNKGRPARPSRIGCTRTRSLDEYARHQVPDADARLR